ncbi:hypothetical protein [Streptomyces sp. NBC_01794]|uniref:hypothetical protein n=1 Tax=Streptomyces sp. NBC_01794 TaxID=2975942 RepID=UPI0030847A36|nr:hypothetical protein OIE54_12075 [Streptomyces sp. NBC_01794]
MPSKEQAQAAMAQILAATSADKADGDQNGGNAQANEAHKAALELAHIVDQAN